MDANEREIFHFLKTWGAEFVGAVEIARRAGSKKKFHENADWAKPVLLAMAERGILESDSNGRYRIKPLTRKEKNSRWISPDIAKILQEGGVEVQGHAEAAPDDYYEQL
jgi:hypothetical protein